MARTLFARRLTLTRGAGSLAAPEPTSAARPSPARGSNGMAAQHRDEGADLGEVLDRVRQRLIARVPPDQLRSYRTDRGVRERLVRIAQDLVAAEAAALGRQRGTALAEQILQDLLGYGPIQPLIDDPGVTEIMVNGPEQVWAEFDGRLSPRPVRFRNAEHLRQVIERIVGAVGRRIDESQPLADARLPDGSRVHAVLPPVGLDGPYLTIRKFGRRLTPQELVQQGALSEQTLAFLAACVRSRCNIIVSGGTGSGKTTLLNALSSFIAADERIVTVEDAAELQLQQPHVVRLETRPANVEGKGAIHIRDLVRNALRMRPDRIIVGECRGGEALDMLQAMNTGHDGSMTTAHANSPADLIRRVETMVLMASEQLPLRAIREQIASALDVVVQVARLRDGSRRVVGISQVLQTGAEESLAVQDLFRFQYEGERGGRALGRLVPTGAAPAPRLLECMDKHNQKFEPRSFGFEGGG